MSPALLVYLVGLVVAWRMLGGHFVYHSAGNYDNDTPDGFDLAFGTILGFMLALCWPGLLVGVGGVRLLMPIVRIFGVRSLTIGAERKHLEERQAKRIKQLERELGYND